MKLCLVMILLSSMSVATGQRRQFLKEVIERIKSSPRHKSTSPSYNGERQFDVIGTGKLPLEDHSYQRMAPEYLPEERIVKQPTRSQPPVSFLGKIFNRFKRKPLLFSSVPIKGKKRPSAASRPTNQPAHKKIPENNFSPPENVDGGFVPNFLGSTPFNPPKNQNGDRSFPATTHSLNHFEEPAPEIAPFHTLREQVSDTFNNNVNKIAQFFSKPKQVKNLPSIKHKEPTINLTQVKNIPSIKQEYGEFSSNEANQHVIALDDEEMKHHREQFFNNALLDPESSHSPSASIEADTGNEKNPFQSENLALNFSVNTPTGYSLFKNGEEKYSAFDTNNNPTQSGGSYEHGNNENSNSGYNITNRDHDNNEQLDNTEEFEIKSFINIGNYGVDWEPKKIRKKRTMLESGDLYTEKPSGQRRTPPPDPTPVLEMAARQKAQSQIKTSLPQHWASTEEENTSLESEK